MRHRFVLCVIALVAAAALSGAASAVTAAVPAVTAAVPAVQPAPGRTLWLPGGAAIVITGHGAAAVMPGGNTLSGTLVSLTYGGTSYQIPVDALPYLGHGLSPSLFDTGSLLAHEKPDRLPVRLSYRGQVPSVPGVTITRSGGGTADGYLTSSSARTFGTALAHQYLADRARASYGTDGMFGSGVSVSVPGAPEPAAPATPAPTPAPTPSATPQYALHTVTVRGTALTGHPDTGDPVYLVNADDVRITGDPTMTGSVFYQGTAKFSVPPGHYFAIGDFADVSADGALAADRVATIPQFTVSGDKTVHLDERAADSEVNVVTPRPAAPVASDFVIWRGDATGLRIGFGLYALAPVETWVAPTHTPVTAGTLQTMLNAWLTSPAASVTPYEYDLAYLWTNGLIPAGRPVVDPASLATARMRYFSAEPVAAFEAREGWFPGQINMFPPRVINTNLLEPWIPVSLPQDRTVYLSAGPSLAWTGLLTTSGPEGGPDLQSDAFRTYAAGQQVTEDWNDYPLHPGVFAHPIAGSFGGLVNELPSASRAGDAVTVFVTPFSDNTDGHRGDFAQTGVTGSYEVDENGSEIDSGTFDQGFFGVQETLGADPSTVSLSLDASRPDVLSTRTQTTWAWRSAHESGGALPAGWFCADGTQDCTVEPMMTLGYHVADLALDDTAPPGAQSLGIDVGHLQLAAAAAITAVTAQVSFDDGATWHAATVTGSGTSYQAHYTAPAGSLVTLKVTAADAAGGRISETIIRAYRTGS